MANSAQVGESLFSGSIRFQNGGPPCAACHAASGLPFPNGGSIGPELSQVVSKLGSQGTDVVLQTLYFPTMRPIFDARPLTAVEQNNLKAFLGQARSGPTLPNILPVAASIALIGLLILLALSWGIWRHRLRNVRKSFVQSVSAGAGKL